jgi:peptide/nickel transport system permease protein
MLKYIIKRILQVFPSIFGVITLIFFSIHLIPGDPVDIMLGETALASNKEEMRLELNLDKPIIEQYIIFLKKIAVFDFGKSFFHKQPVQNLIFERFPATFNLTLASILVALLISLPLGILSAVKKNSFIDYISRLVAMAGISIPNFWLGPMLVIIFSIYLGLLPVSGSDKFSSIILPAITLGASLAAILTRIIRTSMLDVLNEKYIITARSKGLNNFDILFKHTFKNALIPVITIIGLQFGGLLSGAIIVESVFAWPGLGRLLINAINTRDYPVVQFTVLFISVIFIFVNLFTDICYTFVDKRIKL